MPKSYSNLFSKIIDPFNINEAINTVRRTSSDKINILSMFFNQEELVHQIIWELTSGNYKHSGYREITKISGNKERQIYAPYLKDNIIQHAILQVVQPIWSNLYIQESFANQKGKGTSKCNDYVSNLVKILPKDSYYIQFDIRKYFDSIDLEILETIVKKHIREQKLVDLIMTFCRTEKDKVKGIPLGNVLSQQLGLLYAVPLDNFVKHTLREKYYCRYVDDFVIFNISDIQRVKEIKELVGHFIKNTLKLELSKCVINKIKAGINYTGFIHRPTSRVMRIRNMRTLRKNIKQNKMRSVISQLGLARDTKQFSKITKLLINKFYYNMV